MHAKLVANKNCGDFKSPRATMLDFGISNA